LIPCGGTALAEGAKALIPASYAKNRFFDTLKTLRMTAAFFHQSSSSSCQIMAARERVTAAHLQPFSREPAPNGRRRGRVGR